MESGDTPAQANRETERTPGNTVSCLALPSVVSREQKIGIYVHIPFCRTRCPYCDFVSQATPGNVPDAYVSGLCREISAFEGPREATSVFLGGGTPSLLAPKSLETILAVIRKQFRLVDAEITIEANPDDVTGDLVRQWRDLGLNRVSLGIQSFDDRVLSYLSRRHDAAAARRACKIVAARFENWNMDLIFGARPSACWTETLAECVRFAPPHVAAYGLTYETGTPFEHRRQDALDDDAALALYQEAEQALAAYAHYEISNYAKPAFECRHNLIYWHNEEYAGFGTAAYSFLDGVRARNLERTADYLERPGEKAETLRLTDREIRVETVIQHLRLQNGLLKADYARRFGVPPRQDFAVALDTLLARDLIEEDDLSIRPTRQGFYLNNEIGLALVG